MYQYIEVDVICFLLFVMADETLVLIWVGLFWKSIGPLLTQTIGGDSFYVMFPGL